MTELLASLRKQARGTSTRIILPEGHDERVITAAGRLARDDIAEPVLLGPDRETRRLCESLSVPIDDLAFIPRPEGDALEEYAEKYARHRDVPLDTARALTEDDLIFSALLVHLEEVDGMVAGAVNPTAEVVAAANGIVGLKTDITTGSSYFVMEFDDQSIGENGVLLYADCAVNVDPSADQLADIAITTADTAKRLFGWRPRAALLSFSTMGSADVAESRKVATATEIASERLCDELVVGELQADAALVPDVAERKIPTNDELMGDSNILIFPNLDAGNISYKLSQYLAGSKALGPILQGYARPISDVSRGVSVEDLVDITTIVAVQAGTEPDTEGRTISGGLLNRRENSFG